MSDNVCDLSSEPLCTQQGNQPTTRLLQLPEPQTEGGEKNAEWRLISQLSLQDVEGLPSLLLPEREWQLPGVPGLSLITCPLLVLTGPLRFSLPLIPRMHGRLQSSMSLPSSPRALDTGHRQPWEAVHPTHHQHSASFPMNTTFQKPRDNSIGRTRAN